MGVLDLSSNKCHPLEMPNANCSDARLRLDHRTGASVGIFNSRIFVYGGCTLPLDVPPTFTLETLHHLFVDKFTEVQTNSNDSIGGNNNNVNADGTAVVDYNDYLSTECFRLSLINRKWSHYKPDTSSELSEIPLSRMYHAMCVYDNYIYISGGLRFNNDNTKLEILNDLWRFDSIDKRWKCIYENGNNVLLKRYDHLMIMLPNLELFEKSYIHPGICIIGGLDADNNYHQSTDLFDISTHKAYEKRCPNLSEFRQSKEGSSEIDSINVRQTLNAIHSGTTPSTNDMKLFTFDKSPDSNEFEPIILFNNNTKGVRFQHNNGFDIQSISNIEFPTIGTFGENVIVVGFIKNEKKISAYIYNVRTDIWTKLQISCMHKIYTHKLSKGFVWESHHKIAFLGSMNMKDSTGSVDYFNNLVIMSLPFTNFFGKKAVTATTPQRTRFNTPDDIRKRSNSVGSTKSNLSSNRNIPLPQAQTPQAHTGDFAGYAYHVAQQMQVNSIRSVLPAYAIAIGKNAFERSAALSDMDFICSDGSVLSVPHTLCRRRWGFGFDELFADAYAKSYVEENANDMIESGRTSTCDSYSTDADEYSSINSKNSASGPYFRYPFQEKNSSRPNVSPSRVGTSGRLNSISGANSRHNSLSGSLFATAAINRASLSLSQSRRNSSVIGMSRDNSVSYCPSRRSSLTNSAISRRHSLGGLQIPQASTSRRGSTLSKSSLLSSSSNSSPANSLTRQILRMDNIPGGIVSGVPPIRAKLDQGINPTFKFDNIPSQLPMPDVLPDGSPMPPHSSNMSASSSVNDINTNISESEPASRTLSHISTYEEDAFSKKPSNSTNMSNIGRDDLIKTFEHSDFSIDPNTKFNPLRIPRVLYLPYPRSTVHAIIEYLYSGQIGANWKLFPTGIEVLQATKQLGIPLLYDLILELFFVVLGIIESTLRAKLILYLEERSGHNETHDTIYNLLDIKGKDDSDLDWELLLEAANGSRRDSGSTISSDMKIDDVEENTTVNNMNNLDLSDLGPTDKISTTGLISTDMSPTDTRFTEEDDSKIDKVKLNIQKTTKNMAANEELPDEADEHRLKVTIASLDENGYETSSDSEDDDDDDCMGETLMRSFKKFTLYGNNNKHANNTDKTGHHKKLKQWPTFKEMVNDENVGFISETIIELFIETGAMINDTKLMLQAIHVKDMFAKVKMFEETTENEEKLRESIIIEKIKQTSMKKQEEFRNLRNNSNPNSDDILRPEFKKESTPDILLTPLKPMESVHTTSVATASTTSTAPSGLSLAAAAATAAVNRSRSNSRSGSRLSISGSSIGSQGEPGRRSITGSLSGVSATSDTPQRKWIANNSWQEKTKKNDENVKPKDIVAAATSNETSLKKTLSSVSLLSAPGVFIRHLSEDMNSGAYNEALGLQKTSTSNKRSDTPASIHSNVSTNEVNKGADNPPPASSMNNNSSSSNNGLSRVYTAGIDGLLGEDDQSVYSFDMNSGTNDPKKKKRRFFERFRRQQ